MPSATFEPTIPASERSHTHALDRAATGTGNGEELLLPISSRILRCVCEGAWWNVLKCSAC